MVVWLCDYYGLVVEWVCMIGLFGVFIYGLWIECECVVIIMWLVGGLVVLFMVVVM